MSCTRCIGETTAARYRPAIHHEEKDVDTSSYDNTEAFVNGLKVRTEVLGEEYVGPSLERGAADPFTHKLQQFATEYAWGTVWCSDGLDRKTRSIINLSLLCALGREAELRLHTRGAINNLSLIHI